MIYIVSGDAVKNFSLYRALRSKVSPTWTLRVWVWRLVIASMPIINYFAESAGALKPIKTPAGLNSETRSPKARKRKS